MAFPSSPPSAALFGKLPCSLDFVRSNHTSEESIALDRWLQAALQRIAARNQAWPSCVSFCFATASEHSLLGAIANSRDRAGRRFPVAVYARVPRPPRSAFGTAALVLASEPFVSAARAFLGRSAELSPTEIPIALRRLRAPQARDVRMAAEGFARDLAGLKLSDFAGPLFPAATAHERDARAAFDRLRRRPEARTAPPCYDCPARTPRDVAVWAHWLECGHAEASSALWDLPGSARALVAPGPLPERAPLFWVQPTLSHPELCRAVTTATNEAVAEFGTTLGALFKLLD